MTSWDLFEELRNIQDELLRITRLRPQRPGPRYDIGTGRPDWAPTVDISERKDAYLVMAELPGVGIDDVEITFAGGLLTIQGERREAHDFAGERVHRAERRYGTFRRSITLPSHVWADKIEASVQDGVLQILVPKAEEAHAKRIQVRAGKGNNTLASDAAAKKNGSGQQAPPDRVGPGSPPGS